MEHRTIYILAAPLEDAFTPLQMRMALQLAGNETVFPLRWEEDNTQYFGYLPNSLSSYEDAVDAIMKDIIYGDGYREDNVYKLEGNVTLRIIEQGDNNKGRVFGTDFVAVQTPMGLLKAIPVNDAEYPGVTVMLENEHGQNVVSLAEYSATEGICGYDPMHPEFERKERAEVHPSRISEDEQMTTAGIITRAWSAISVPDDSEMGVARYVPRNIDWDSPYVNTYKPSKPIANRVAVPTPVGTLVATPYRELDGNHKTYGIEIRLTKDGREISVLNTEYVEEEPFCGDADTATRGQDVPPQRRFASVEGPAVLPGLITRYWTDQNDMDEPARRAFHF